MTQKQMTYNAALQIAIETLGNCEATERLKTLQETLAKRNATRSTSMTKAQKENEAHKEALLAVLKEDADMSPTEVGAATGLSVAKVGALMKQLIESGRAVKVVDGRKTGYHLA